MLWLIGWLLLLIGVVVCTMGRHGRRIDHHLLCRACGFDLFNRPENARRCPECGADTTRRHAFRVGNRRLNQPVAFAGTALAGLAVGLLTLAAARWASQADWIAWTPMGVLRSEVVATASPARARVADELLRRLHAGRGSDREVSLLVDALLARQGTRDWCPAWGDLVQGAIIEGRASPAQIDRYVQQMVAVTFELRPRMRAGDPLPVALICNFRGGSELGPLAGALVRPQITLALKGGPTWHLKVAGQSLDPAVPMPISFAAAIDPSGPSIAPGGHLAHLECTLTLLPQRAGINEVRIHRAADLGFQVLPPGASSVEVVENPELAGAMNNAVRLMAGDHWEGDRLGYLTMADPPMPVAFRVLIEQNHNQWLVGRFITRPNAFARIPLLVSGMKQKPVPGRIQVLLVPDPDLAAGTTSILQVWGGTLRVEGIAP